MDMDSGTLGRTRGVFPLACRLGEPEIPEGSLWSLHDLWYHLGRHVAPMLAVFVVTVASGTRCARYGLTGPLDTEHSNNPYRFLLTFH